MSGFLGSTECLELLIWVYLYSFSDSCADQQSEMIVVPRRMYLWMRRTKVCLSPVTDLGSTRSTIKIIFLIHSVLLKTQTLWWTRPRLHFPLLKHILSTSTNFLGTPMGSWLCSQNWVTSEDKLCQSTLVLSLILRLHNVVLWPHNFSNQWLTKQHSLPRRYGCWLKESALIVTYSDGALDFFSFFGMVMYWVHYHWALLPW